MRNPRRNIVAFCLFAFAGAAIAQAQGTLQFRGAIVEPTHPYAMTGAGAGIPRSAPAHVVSVQSIARPHVTGKTLSAPSDVLGYYARSMYRLGATSGQVRLVTVQYH